MTLQEQIGAYTPWNEQERSDRRIMLRSLAQFTDLLTRENETQHFTASAWIVNPARTKTVMIYHNIYNSWAWTGGHADGEEDLLTVAIREAEEETGLACVPVQEEIFSLEILGVDAHVRRGRHVSAHLHLNLTFLLEAPDDVPLRIKPDENSNVAWFAMEDAAERSSEPEMQVVYRKLIAKLREQTA